MPEFEMYRVSAQRELVPVGMGGLVKPDRTLYAPGGWEVIDGTDPGPGDGGGGNPGTTRMPRAWAFAADDPYNTSVAATATFSTTDAAAVRMRSLGPSSGVNKGTYSVRQDHTTDATPFAKVTNIGLVPNVVYNDVRITPTFEPPLGGGGGVADANSVIIHPNGYTVTEFFKLTRVKDANGNPIANEWTCRRRVEQDFRGSAILRGVRATGNALRAGLILKDELAKGVIPHALAISLHERDLKLTPTSADGQVSTNGKAVWPGNTQDTQVPGKLEYIGPIPMGSWFVCDPAINPATATLANGTPLNSTQKAILQATIDYGWSVTDRSGYSVIYMEPECSDTQASDARLVWREVIVPNAMRMTNQRSDNIGGGSGNVTRRRPAAPPFDPSIPAL